MPTAASDVTQKDVQAAYQALYDLLSDEAYWAASTIEAKDHIYGLIQVIFDILTALNKAGLAQRTAEFKQVSNSVQAVNTKLETTKTQIHDLIQKVELAVQIAGAIDKAIALAAKFFV